MSEDVWHSVAGGLPNMLDPTMVIQQNSYNTNQVKQTQMRCTKRKHTWSKKQESRTQIPSQTDALQPPRAQAPNFTYPMTTQEMAVPKKAYVKMDPRFWKKCLWGETENIS